MIAAILMAALTLGALPQVADTTVSVERGERLEIDNFRGDVTIRGWTRDAVRVRAELDGRQELDVVRTGAAVRVRPRSSRGGPQDADFVIDVPRWMNVRIEGMQVDVDVSGTEGEINVETVGGDIVVDGGGGMLHLRSIQGGIEVRNARAKIDAASVNKDVTLTSVTGDIYVETTNGDVVMRGIRSAATRASTVNGDIAYAGTISDQGTYVFSTHNGDVVVAVPENTSATVSVSTYHGEFDSEFPVRLTGTTRDKKFNFTLGAGGARLELESFNGEILLRRP